MNLICLSDATHVLMERLELIPVTLFSDSGLRCLISFSFIFFMLFSNLNAVSEAFFYHDKNKSWLYLHRQFRHNLFKTLCVLGVLYHYSLDLFGYLGPCFPQDFKVVPKSPGSNIFTILNWQLDNLTRNISPFFSPLAALRFEFPSYSTQSHSITHI